MRDIPHPQSAMSLSSITSGQIKAIRLFITEIPAEKLIPTGFAGTLYPPDKDKEEGGWRLDEQGYTTAKLAYNLQIQLNTTGVGILDAMLRDVERR
jgi:hypothetical protein